ncbi:MAG: hypothetical protein P8X64_08895 [Anaerolineales bacterium]|jgi:hypothetical protein
MKIQKLATISLAIVTLLAACGSYGVSPTATPTAAAAPSSAGTDWMMHGFPNVIATQDFTPGTAATITAGPYTVSVPADAFTAPVTINLLSGDPSSFSSDAPSGEVPVLAFAFNVRDANGNLIVKFSKPVTLTAKDAQIYADSQYFNVAPSGSFTENPTGLRVSAGQLSHPIAGTPVGWVITTPASEVSMSSGG